MAKIAPNSKVNSYPLESQRIRPELEGLRYSICVGLTKCDTFVTFCEALLYGKEFCLKSLPS